MKLYVIAQAVIRAMEAGKQGSREGGQSGQVSTVDEQRPEADGARQEHSCGKRISGGGSGPCRAGLRAPHTPQRQKTGLQT